MSFEHLFTYLPDIANLTREQYAAPDLGHIFLLAVKNVKKCHFGLCKSSKNFKTLSYVLQIFLKCDIINVKYYTKGGSQNGGRSTSFNG